MNNSDIFLVNRNGISHKVRLDTIRNDVNAPVSQEIADLKQKDIDLDRKIDILQLDVNQNEADSDAADAALSARIDALEADPGVDLSGYATKEQLNNEEAARIAGDNSLDGKITNEVNARISGDNALDDKIHDVNTRIDTLAINPIDFGAKADGVTDDSDAINAALEYAADLAKQTINGDTYKGGVVDGNGLVYAIKKPINFKDGYLTFRNATLVALDGFETRNVSMPDLEGISVPDVVTDAMVVANGGNQHLENITLECRFVANGYHRIKNGFWSYCKDVAIREFKDTGFNIEPTSNSGQWFVDCQVDQSSEVTKRTGISFHLKVSDAKIMNSTIRHARIPLQLECQTVLIDSCHIYNGADASGIDDDIVNQTIIYQTTLKGVDPYNPDSFNKTSGGNSISNCYLGKGKIVLEYPCHAHFTGNRNLFSNDDIDCAFELVANRIQKPDNSFDTGPWNFPEKLVISGYAYQDRIYKGVMDYIKLVDGDDTWSTSAHAIVDAITEQDTWVQSNVGSSLYNNTLIIGAQSGGNLIVKNPSYEYKFQQSGFKPDDDYDALLDLGDGNQRWKKVYASQGTIDTSDERYKNSIVDLDRAEINVAKAVRKLVKRFKFNGEDKYSVGLIAQQVIAAFEAEGLDPFEYSIIDNEGEYYGVNYSQLLCFIIGGLD